MIFVIDFFQGTHIISTTAAHEKCTKHNLLTSVTVEDELSKQSTP
jgi:hypothetical protein